MTDPTEWIREQIADPAVVADLEPAGVNVVRSDPSYVQRFLEMRPCKAGEVPAKALALLVRCLRWRQQFRTASVTVESESDQAVADLNIFTFQNADNDGNPLLVLRMSRFRTIKVRGLYEEAARVVVATLEGHFKANMSGRTNATLVVDLRKCCTAEVDFEFCRFLVDCFDCYYPGSLGRVVLLALPWNLTAQWALVKTLFPHKSLPMVTKVKWHEIRSHVDPNFINAASSASGGGLHKRQSSLKDSDSEAGAGGKRRVTFGGEVPQSGLAPGELPQHFIAKVTPPKEIVFAQNEHLLLQSSITVQNGIDKWIMFKIKTTSPESYRVKPNIGAIAPGEVVTVDLSRRRTESVNEPFRDKFLVMTAVFPDLEAETFAATDSAAERRQEVASTMFKRLPKSQVTEFKLHTNYTGVVEVQAANTAASPGGADPADDSSPMSSPRPSTAGADDGLRQRRPSTGAGAGAGKTGGVSRQGRVASAPASRPAVLVLGLTSLAVGVLLGMVIEELLSIGILKASGL